MGCWEQSERADDRTSVWVAADETDKPRVFEMQKRAAIGRRVEEVRARARGCFIGALFLSSLGRVKPALICSIDNGTDQVVYLAFKRADNFAKVNEMNRIKGRKRLL